MNGLGAGIMKGNQRTRKMFIIIWQSFGFKKMELPNWNSQAAPKILVFTFDLVSGPSRFLDLENIIFSWHDLNVSWILLWKA